MFARALIVLSFASTIFASSSAAAGWRYAEWGMSPSKVVEASERQAWNQYREGYAKCRGLVQGEHEAASYRFDVFFCFEEDRLVLIRLEPIGVEEERDAAVAFKVLKDELIAQYGKPHTDVGVDAITRRLGIGGELMWRDREDGNQVRLRRVSELVAIEYRPLDGGL